MILYVITDKSAPEPRFYINLGVQIMEMFNFTEESQEPERSYYKTAFNPFFMDTVKGLDLSTDAGKKEFLENFLGGFVPAQLQDLYQYPSYFKYGIEGLYGTGNKTTCEIIRTFLLDYFFPRYWSCYLSSYSKSQNYEDIEEAYIEWFNKFAQTFSATSKKYLILMKALKEKENSLMEQLSSWSYGATKYNDTPQNSGYFYDDSHTSNITQTDTKTASDFETPIKRLKEISDNLEIFYNAWAQDFDKLFSRINQSL